MSRALLTSCAAVLLLAPVAALAGTGKLQVHSRNSGVLDASGYTKVRTSTDSLSFEMPCQYNEMSFADAPRGSNGSPYTTSALIVICAEPMRGAADAMMTQTAYDTGAAGADFFFDQQQRDDSKAGTVELRSYRGDRALLSSVRREGRCQWKLLVRHGDRLVAMNYFAASADCASTRMDADRFLFSLEFAE